MGSFVICTHYRVLFDCDRNKDEGMCKACDTYTREEKCRNLKERDNVKGLDIDR